MLFYLIEGDYYTLKPVARKAKKSEKIQGDRTLTLIDAFLEGLPPEDNIPLFLQPEVKQQETELSLDYNTYVLREDELLDTADPDKAAEQTSPMKGQQLIDDFIKNADNKGAASEKSVDDDIPVEALEESQNNGEDEEDESCFTETLAKIYIKQHRYEKALEIIKRLSLKYPKKNAYFADQIRFLEKLVINSNDK